MKNFKTALSISWTLINLVAAPTAIAAQPAKPARLAKAPAKARRLASREPVRGGSLRADGRLPRERKEWEARVALVGGFAQLNSSDGAEQSARDKASFKNGAYGGLQADVTVAKYLGAEVEGFFGQGATRSLTSVDRVTGTISTSDRQLRQLGGMGAALGRLPLWIGNVKIVPKAGVGYGYLKLDGNGPQGEDSKLTGAYGTIGFDVSLTSDLLVSADYARSFASSGETSTSAADASHFDRIRAGAYYRVAEPVLVGGQYLRRTLSLTGTSGSQEVTETSNQFLGALMIVF